MVVVWEATVSPSILLRLLYSHQPQVLDPPSADIFGHKSSVRQLWTICGHKSRSFLQLLGPGHTLSKYTQDDDTSRVLYRQNILEAFCGFTWQGLIGKNCKKSFALCQAGLISKSLTLEFQISKVVTVDFGLLHFGKLLTQHSAGSNTV